MFTFRGSVSNGAGGIHTLSELIAIAIAARTYASAAREAEAISRFKNVLVANVLIRPKDGIIYLMDAYKGVVNGTVSGGVLVAGDFTAEPGGGIPIASTDANREYWEQISLSNTLVYSVDAEVFYLDVTAAA